MIAYLIFFVLIGACVGSFLNVVVYRLPAGESLVHPGSRCPRCGHKLAWRDNIPVLGWIVLRGRCRYCRDAISGQYPIVEASTAALFGVWFAVCYMTPLRPAFAFAGPVDETLLIFVVSLALIGSLIAATLIDARLYIIPLSIPWLITGGAVVLLPLAVWLFPGSVREARLPAAVAGEVMALPSERLRGVEPAGYAAAGEVRAAAIRGDEGPIVVAAAPWVGSRSTGAALGGAIGLALALGLMRLGILRRSFTDAISAEQDDQPLAAHEENVPQLVLPLGAILGVGVAAIIHAEDWLSPVSMPPMRALIVGLIAGYMAGAIVLVTIGRARRRGGGGGEGGGEAGDAKEDDGVVFEAHPHTRREMMWEVGFLALPMAGMVAGAMVVGPGERWADVWHVLGGVVMGYLVGGGVVWIVRVLGSLGFGKEAMGLGDVHLMGAVGAVAGWEVAGTAFFLAAFMGIAHVLLTLGLGRVMRFRGRQIPFGPQLAAATLVAMILREPVAGYLGLFGG